MKISINTKDNERYYLIKMETGSEMRINKINNIEVVKNWIYSMDRTAEISVDGKKGE